MNEVTKSKHPGRVAAGKRTAELNRKRKEDLLSNREKVPPQVDSGTESVHGGNSSWKYGGAVAIVVGVGFFALYFYHEKKPIFTTHPLESNNDIFSMN